MEHEKAVKAQTATSTGICCDMCSKDANLLIPVTTLSPRVGNTRSVSSEEKETLRHNLITLRKSLLSELLCQAPKGELPVSTFPDLLTGFSDHQISQVLENCDKIFSVSDVKTEIWKERHAHVIMDIISDVFQDIHQEDRQSDDHRDYYDGDDEEEDYWNELFNDADFMNVDWDDVSSSNIDDSSFLVGSLDFESSCMHVPELGGLIDKVQIQ